MKVRIILVLFGKADCNSKNYFSPPRSVFTCMKNNFLEKEKSWIIYRRVCYLMSYIWNFDAVCEHAYINPSTCSIDEFQNTRIDLSLLGKLAVRNLWQKSRPQPTTPVNSNMLVEAFIFSTTGNPWIWFRFVRIGKSWHGELVVVFKKGTISHDKTLFL